MQHTHTASCPVTAVASLLSDTWTMLIIHNLMGASTMRFCDLERALVGISTRTLTIKLTTLVEEGILSKGEEGYALTPVGKKLKPVLKEMETFGKGL